MAAADEVCVAYGAGDDVVVEDIPALESSGVAPARASEGVYYTHDDEEGAPKLYLFQLDGRYLGEQTVRNATNVDWEDVAAGPCPETVGADRCLWIADVGDNDEVRDGVVVYVVPESQDAAVDAVACPVRYPEGKRWNAEALLVDPEGQVRIVTKEGDGEAHVFLLAEPRCDGSEQDLAEEAELLLGEEITGGAVSEDGAMVALRSTGKAWLWRCGVDWDAEPEEMDLSLGSVQGEAIAFAADGSLVTTSELVDEDTPFRAWSIPCEQTAEPECSTCGCGGGGSAAVLAFVPLAALRRRRRA